MLVIGNQKGRQRQLLPSSLGTLDATSKVPFPLWQTEARQHKRNEDVASDVCLGGSCCPWAGADSLYTDVSMHFLGMRVLKMHNA